MKTNGIRFVMVVSVIRLGRGRNSLAGRICCFRGGKEQRGPAGTPLPKTATPQIPAFAERSKIPAFGKQARPVKSPQSSETGNRDKSSMQRIVSPATAPRALIKFRIRVPTMVP